MAVRGEFGQAMWSRVKTWFAAQASQVTVEFLPDPAGQLVRPYDGYLRVWLAEGFLAKARTWGTDRFPALHGGVCLDFLGSGPSSFTTFSRSPESWRVPGSRSEFPMTPLLPFCGGTVEIEAALYQVSTASPLRTALDLISSLASLMGPPLTVAATVADKLSDGLDRVLEADGANPVLGVHRTLVSLGTQGLALRSGYLVVLDAPQHQLPGSPEIVDGKLHLRVGDVLEPPTGIDYLVVWVECRTERDDWRFPELDEAIRAAGSAFIRNDQVTFQDLRNDAICRAWNSTDLTPLDRRRVALMVSDELNRLSELRAVPGEGRLLEAIAPQMLPPADDDRLNGLTLTALL